MVDGLNQSSAPTQAFLDVEPGTTLEIPVQQLDIVSVNDPMKQMEALFVDQIDVCAFRQQGLEIVWT